MATMFIVFGIVAALLQLIAMLTAPSLVGRQRPTTTADLAALQVFFALFMMVTLVGLMLT